MTTLAEEWVSQLVRDFPGLAPEYSRHFDGQELPVAANLLRRLSRWFVAAFEEGDIQTTLYFLDRLEDDYQSFDRQTRKILDNVFIRELPWPGEPGAEVADLLRGPLLERYREFHHGGVVIADWIAGLAKAFPEIEPLYREHLSTFEQLIPSVFLGDAVSWLEDAGSPSKSTAGRAFLARVEADYPELDSHAQEYVRDSIAWALPFAGEPGADIENWLGPTLRALYDDAH